MIPVAKSILKVFALCLLTIILLEIVCRIYFSTQEFKNCNYKLFIELSDSSIVNVKNHEFKNLVFRLDENDNFSFYQTLNENGCRITCTNERKKYLRDKPKIVFAGCSFTEGEKVNDTSVFAYKLQNKVDDYQIINAGKGGFGASMALNRIQYLTEKYDDIDYVFYNYLSFHKIRDYKNYFWISNLLKAKVEMVLIENDSIITTTKNLRNRYLIFSDIKPNDSLFQFTYQPKMIYIQLLDFSKLFLLLNNVYSYFELKFKEKKMTKVHCKLPQKLTI